MERPADLLTYCSQWHLYIDEQVDDVSLSRYRDEDVIMIVLTIIVIGSDPSGWNHIAITTRICTSAAAAACRYYYPVRLLQIHRTVVPYIRSCVLTSKNHKTVQCDLGPRSTLIGSKCLRTD